jgi:predicted ATP-dependent endonuclease of OLD family
MKLIKSLELRYFRSVYKQKLDKLEHLNIFFGRNDSGKSNFLRALNLFFHGTTNPGQKFTFNRDFSHARLSEANDLKDARKFVSVKIWFTTPNNWRKALGSEFWVKKTWSITRQEEPSFESSIRDQSKMQFLTRFLNKVRFHYIPAIKDRHIFEDLLEQVYTVAAKQEEFVESLQDFSIKLRETTEDLSNGLLDKLAVRSFIAPPTDLAELFRSLDFETQGEHGDSYSLTLQRGDGIQVRHIPLILAFLSDRGSQNYHIWGFEEPENSLELANAIEEAKVFLGYARDSNKQIFLTSHSAAFFNLIDDEVKRYFVSKAEEVKGRKVSVAHLIDKSGDKFPSELMGETPHLPVISQYLREADEKIRQLRDESEELSSMLEQRDRDLVFVEGKSDEIILSAAWREFCNGDAPFDFVDSIGTTKMQSLAKDGRTLNRLAPNRKIYVIVDNDKEGRELYKNGRLDGGGRWVEHNSNGSYWCRLPWTGDFSTIMQSMNVPKTLWPGTIENLFSSQIKSMAQDDSAYLKSKCPHDELFENGNYSRIADALNDETDAAHLYVRTIDHEYKLEFANWVNNFSQEDNSILEPLRGVVVSLEQLISKQ